MKILFKIVVFLLLFIGLNACRAMTTYKEIKLVKTDNKDELNIISVCDENKPYLCSKTISKNNMYFEIVDSKIPQQPFNNGLKMGKDDLELFKSYFSPQVGYEYEEPEYKCSFNHYNSYYSYPYRLSDETLTKLFRLKRKSMIRYYVMYMEKYYTGAYLDNIKKLTFSYSDYKWEREKKTNEWKEMHYKKKDKYINKNDKKYYEENMQVIVDLACQYDYVDIISFICSSTSINDVEIDYGKCNSNEKAKKYILDSQGVSKVFKLLSNEYKNKIIKNTFALFLRSISTKNIDKSKELIDILVIHSNNIYSYYLNTLKINLLEKLVVEITKSNDLELMKYFYNITKEEYNVKAINQLLISVAILQKNIIFIEYILDSLNVKLTTEIFISLLENLNENDIKKNIKYFDKELIEKALYISVYKGELDKVKEILKLEPKLDIVIISLGSVKNISNRGVNIFTPLGIASKKKFQEIVGILRKAGAKKEYIYKEIYEVISVKKVSNYKVGPQKQINIKCLYGSTRGQITGILFGITRDWKGYFSVGDKAFEKMENAAVYACTGYAE